MLKSIVVSIACVSLAIACCNGMTNSSTSDGVESTPNVGVAEPMESEVQPAPSSDEQISRFVRRIFQDKSGNLWFGTNGDGVIRYDGDALKYFSIDEGFGGVAVRGIVDDKEGNVWFGTEGGITKYDGESFTNFTEKDGLVNNDVWSIVIDSKGIIWVGTLQGVSRFDGKKFTPFELPASERDPTRGVTSARIVHCIMEDSKGKMWFATNGGAYIYDGKSLTNISETDGLCHNSVNCILEDKHGNIWFATHHNGVCRWDGKSFTHFTKQDGVVGTEAWNLYEDKSGNIWFPIENSGVYHYDGKTFTNFQKEQGLTTNAIQCTFEDKQGRLWLGGWQGLFRYDGKSIFSVGKKGPWPGKNKTELPKDKEVKDSSLKPALTIQFEEKIRPLLAQYCADCHAPGEMKDLDFLAATTHSDIAGLRDVYAGVTEAMENRTMPPGNSDQPSDTERKLVTEWIMKTLDLKSDYFDRIAQYVVEPYEDKKGNLWFGTMHKGAARYDGKTLTWFSKKDGLPSNAVPSFAEDKDGNLWVGTHDGVCKFNGKTFTRLGSAEGLPDRSSPSPMAWSSVQADSKGNIWASMGQSIFRYDGKSFAEFKIPIVNEKISSYAIVAGRVSLKLEDKTGNLWFGTDGDGAYKFDGKSFTHYSKKDGLCSNNVTSILEDKQGNIWFTCIQSYQPEMTGDGGVCRYDGKTFTKFPTVKGLSENDIYTIYETKAGNIWIGASRVGAYRYDGETFTLFSETDRKHWTRNFGLQGMIEDRNGTLWFGFSGGLFRFNGTSFFNVTEDGPWSGPPTPNTTSEQATGSDVDALLEQLQPSSIVVDGDPIETTTLAELMREHQVPGVSIAVIRNGKIDWARGFGIADVETGRAVTPQTLFQAASISKPVAAAAALSMVQDGLLDLDEDVNLKLKSWKLPSNEFTDQQPVTLRHLLSHTAGTTVHGFPGYARDANWPSTIDILEGRGNTDPVRVDTLPGSNWRYSGGGYTIIGQLMEDVAGKPYPEILRERVLEPAGMTHSTYVQPLPLARESDATTAYVFDGSPVEGRYHNYPEIGAAGLWTTAEDLARFALAIQQSRAGKPDSLLSPRLISEMLTPGKNNWGLGPALSENGDRFGHGGANEGFRTLLSASLDDGWGIVVMTNGDGGGPLCELVRMAASKSYGWSAFEPTRRKRVDIGEVALARIAGKYECLPEWSHARSRLALFPNMGTLEFKAINGRLIADVPEGARTQGRVEFLPQSEFQVMQRRNGRLMDLTVEDGQVTGFKFRGFEARRVD